MCPSLMLVVSGLSDQNRAVGALLMKQSRFQKTHVARAMEAVGHAQCYSSKQRLVFSCFARSILTFSFSFSLTFFFFYDLPLLSTCLSV